MKKPLFLFILILAIGIGGFMWRHNAAAPSHKNNAPGTSFDKSQYSLNTPASLWVVVNKQRPLSPKDYTPKVTVPNVPLRLSSSDQEMHVSVQMAPALQQLFAAAKNAGVPMRLASGYRSYQEQVTVYGAEIQNYGQTQADKESARPGFSEHQTGLAADVEPLDRTCEVQVCFESTAQGKWLAANAYRYGFIIRYPKGKENVTGYEYEPWHIRYVGTQLSNEIRKTGITTLEEFFDLPAAPRY